MSILAVNANAFIALQSGLNGQSSTPWWTNLLGTSALLGATQGKAVARDSSGNIFVGGYTDANLDGNMLTGTNDYFVTKYNSSGTKQWTRQLGVASKVTQCNGVATDTSGNVFIAGYTNGGLDGNTLTGTQDFFVTKYDSSGTKLWTKQLGIASQFTTGSSVATDSSGNVFIAGYTNGGLDGNTLTGIQDFFVTKYDSSGVKQWTRQLGVATYQTSGNSVTTDSSGNIFVGGYTRGGLDGNTLTGSFDFFLTKYDSSGAKQWTQQMGNYGGGNTFGNAVATDNSGNIFIVGTSSDLDGNVHTGSYDVVVTKYDSSGAKQWTRELGAPYTYTFGYTYGNAVATDNSGNIFIGGDTNGDFDGNTLTGLRDFFVAKFDSSGTKQWSKQLGVASVDTLGYGLVADSAGNILITGYTAGGLDGNTLTGIQDLFLSKYDSSGTKVFTQLLGSNTKKGTVNINGTSADSSGNVFVGGYTAGALDGNTAMGVNDFFVTKYDLSGAKQWTRQLGVATKNTYGNAVAADPSGTVFIAGYTDGGLDGNTLTGTQDFFVTKYNSSGTKHWTNQLGVASRTVQGTTVATDSSGNVFVAGYTTGGLDGNALMGSGDFFVTKYDSSGAKQWTRQLGISGGVRLTQGYGVATDTSGNVFITGYTTGSGTFDGNSIASTGTYLFVTKYDSSGTKKWSKTLGVGFKNTRGLTISTNSSGSAFISGYTNGNLDGNALAGTQDLFVTKYDSAGTKQWTKLLGVSAQVLAANGVVVDNSGNIFITGTSTGAADGNTLKGTQDLIVVKYNPSGIKQWTKQFGATSLTITSKGISTDNLGNIFVGGFTTGGLDQKALTGTTDGFVIRYGGN